LRRVQPRLAEAEKREMRARVPRDHDMRPNKEAAFWSEEAAALRLRLTELLSGTEPDAGDPGPSSPEAE
jgi:hypothetical protein